MTDDEASPIAEMLVHSYLETASYSRAFNDEHGQPPTMLTKVHHLRSICQAMLNQDDRYRLGQDYAEFGRVQFEVSDTGQIVLLRSDSAVSIEASKRASTLFDPDQFLASAVTMLIYKFHADGLDLAHTGTSQEVGRRRLVATGAPIFIGTWPYTTDGESFSQDEGDAFPDLGDIDLDKGESDEL